jgi:hypothetical protein
MDLLSPKNKECAPNKMPTPDISPREHLTTYHRRINNIIIHLFKNKEYGVMAMSVDERPPPDIREALYHYCCHTHLTTPIGGIERYRREGFWELTILRISQNQFLVRFSPTVYAEEGSDAEEEEDEEIDPVPIV